MSKLDLTKPVRTRDGRTVTILTTAATAELKDLLQDGDAACYFAKRDTVIAQVQNPDGGTELNGYTEDGRFSCYDCADDLVNYEEPSPVEVSYRAATLRNYGTAYITFGGVSFRTAEDAARAARLTPRRFDAVLKVSTRAGRLVDLSLVETIEV